MIGYEVTYDKEQVADAISYFEFVGGNTDRAFSIAINRTTKKVKTISSRHIRNQVRLKASYVNEKKQLDVAQANRNKLVGKVFAGSRGLLLSKYSTDPQLNGKTTWLLPPPVPTRGIRVKVKPTGTTKSLSKDYFYMVLKNSKALGIVRRKTTPGAQGGTIDVAYSPSVSQVFNTVRDDILQESAGIYEYELLDAMRFILAKKYPKE